ncbi:hypothetical protein [Pseudonocardia kunmingensis]|uniref:t-SNARE coiled-coil homology domain-containing protein n=1 Tax=Pseudonocardia kunmingensis TaxID=630975 RepID=A0A543E1Z0_9PSEU|nr:hypothetical protein [Pseudonocardia kunmingensis]TQM15611.1 hypothetical protein FB558_2401 [Pseudonocardia kunmingensis]
MAGDDELERKVRKLAIEHAETRWLALHLDDDVKEIRQELRTMRTEQNGRFDAIERELDEHGRKLDEHGRLLQEHGGKLQEHDSRFDSVDAQLRSLTQMVGQVLDRIPEKPAG